jgi:hypothetical protein
MNNKEAFLKMENRNMPFATFFAKLIFIIVWCSSSFEANKLLFFLDFGKKKFYQIIPKF